MMNRMKSGSIIWRPAAITANTNITAMPERCGLSQRTYSRRCSRRLPLSRPPLPEDSAPSLDMPAGLPAASCSTSASSFPSW